MSTPPPRFPPPSSPYSSSAAAGVVASSPSPSLIIPSSHSSFRIPITALLAIVAAAVIIISAIFLLSICICRKKKPRSRGNDFTNRKDSPCGYSSAGSVVRILPPPHQILTSWISSAEGHATSFAQRSKVPFTYEELAAATSGFARYNLVGEGPRGYVYKGVLLGGQLNVAVKRLKAGREGQSDKEFRTEVERISEVHHRHIVSLVGYCMADHQRLLVYDYVPNGNLNHHLHGKGRTILDWPTRVKIASGVGRGLAYLHEECHPCVIHCNIKASNVLVDKDFNAQVSDFGFAKPASDMKIHGITKVVGTFGLSPFRYPAAEYASSGKPTEKLDVYSFGLVLLEIVSGRRPLDPTQSAGEESLVEWARPLLRQINGEEKLELLADPFLNGAYDCKEMMCLLEVAAACIHHSATMRPRMSQVVRALEDNADTSDLVSRGVKPGHSHTYGSFTSLDFDNSSYSMDIKGFCHNVVFESQDCSSEYSGAASEYGISPSSSSNEF